MFGIVNMYFKSGLRNIYVQDIVDFKIGFLMQKNEFIDKIRRSW